MINSTFNEKEIEKSIEKSNKVFELKNDLIIFENTLKKERIVLNYLMDRYLEFETLEIEINSILDSISSTLQQIELTKKELKKEDD